MATQIVKLGVAYGADIHITGDALTLATWIEAHDVLRRVTIFDKTIVSVTRNGKCKYALVGRPKTIIGSRLAPKNKACRDAVRQVIAEAQHYPTLEAAIAAHILTHGHDDVPL